MNDLGMACSAAAGMSEKKTMDVYDLIAGAIRNKRNLTAEYGGYVRKLCPHALGTKNGRVQCLFYQYDGGSRRGILQPGSPDNWRCIPLDGLSNVAFEAGEWCTAENYSRPNTCIDDIEVEVEF